MKFAKNHLAAAAALALCPLASAQIGTYSEDFESLTCDAGALAGDGWLTYTTVFNADGSFAYGYGGSAPNGGPGFSVLNDTYAGPDQGRQYVNIYSDYNNGDHANGLTIEANVYRERGIDAADVGQTFTFEFDYLKNPEGNNGDGATQTFAFIKVLKRSDFSFATLTQINVDTTAASTTAWATDSIEVTIDPTWDGELFQFGFYSTASNYDDSSRLYDNLSCSAPGSEPPGSPPTRRTSRPSTRPARPPSGATAGRCSPTSSTPTAPTPTATASSTRPTAARAGRRSRLALAGPTRARRP